MDNIAVISTTTLGTDDAADLLNRLDDPARLWPALLALIARRLPCDACALLRQDGDRLRPLATRGLSPDTLGRRFRLDEHPRLKAIAESGDTPLRFPTDCALPDP